MLPAVRDPDVLGLEPARPRTPGSARPALPAWPVTGLLLLYPLWWALGLGVLIFPLMALPMAWYLIRGQATGRPVRLPPGFLLWLLFLAVVVVGIGALGSEPVGAVPEPATDRLLGVGYRLGQYVALTVMLIYAGNLTARELSQRRLVRLLGWLFVVTVGGGLLGMLAGAFEFTSPVEMLLPTEIRDKGFVQSLVHPYAAQIHDILGDHRPRPAAPWGYTNTWGNNFCLLVVWFCAAAFAPGTRVRTKLLAVATLAVSLGPVVVSLNRGLWIGLGVAAVYCGVRLAFAGRRWVIGAFVAGLVVIGVALTATPLGDVVSARLDNGKSNGVRSFLVDRAVTGAAESPLIGFGSTRDTIGGRNSITVGESHDCERCGNFTIGGNGQFWQLIFAHGLLGTLAYLGFFGYGIWRFRRDRSPVGIAGGAALVGTFVAMLWYNALVTPLAFMFLAYALLWRNAVEKAEGTPV